MVVRAKFIVTEKTERPSTQDHGGVFDVKLGAVSDGSEENKRFFKWTPAGQFQLVTINSEAADGFEVGKSYYVDFTKAEQ